MTRNVDSSGDAGVLTRTARTRVRTLERGLKTRTERPKQAKSSASRRTGRSRRRGARTGILLHPQALGAGALVLLMLIAGGLWWWLSTRNYESTDDAFIDAHMVRIAPQIAGRVTQVPVGDNQLVHRGDFLLEIDQAEAQSRVNQIQAQLAAARSQLAQDRAKIVQAQASHQQALAAARAAEAEAEAAGTDLARYQRLEKLNPQAVARQRLDQAQAQARNTAAQYQAAVQQARSVAAGIPAANAQLKSAQDHINALQAQVSEAQTNLNYTRIDAPITGHIAQRNVAVGSYLSAGQQVMALVPLTMWVTANFKETQLDGMKPGQPADVTIDACPGADIKGHVDSIQTGAGQAFEILPPENATGNFVKVVQRVPVKIDLDRLPADCPLGPGMSAQVSVKVR
jgi:membrane fusion protein, multidrug efflux system